MQPCARLPSRTHGPSCSSSPSPPATSPTQWTRTSWRGSATRRRGLRKGQALPQGLGGHRRGDAGLASQDGKDDGRRTPRGLIRRTSTCPLLTIAALQFNARMYPAAVKGDEAILCKVIGQDNGISQVTMPNPQSGQMQPVPQMDPQTGQPVDGRWQDGPAMASASRSQGQTSKAGQRISEHDDLLPHGRVGGRHRRPADPAAGLSAAPSARCGTTRGRALSRRWSRR
jgi:hypothetical protein